MTNITLKQLRYFEALAHHGHFGHAASASAISQPALSVQVKELEQEIGAILFERGPKRVKLTMFGEEFALRAREVLRGIEQLEDLSIAAKERMIGRLRIGIIPTIAPYLLPTIIGDLSHSYAGLDIQVRETQTAKLITELHDGRLDAAIVALPISEKNLIEIPIFDEEFVLVRPPKDADKPIPSRDSLREMKLLLLEEGHCFRDQALSFCGVPSALPKEGLDASSLSTLVQMVSAGIGITLVPEMAVPMETRGTHVTVSRFPAPAPTRTIGMIWRKTTPLMDDFLKIAQVVQDCATKNGNVVLSRDHKLGF